MARYSERVQPMIDGVVRSLFTDASFRAWVLEGTHHAEAYSGAEPLMKQQHALRPNTRQPFYSNYFCGRDSRCTCRVPGSRSLETDAMVFLRSSTGRILGLHIEVKRPGEPLGFGQAEGYPLRAACWAEGGRKPRTVPAHHDWLTVLVCGRELLADQRVRHFDRVLLHADLAAKVDGFAAA